MTAPTVGRGREGPAKAFAPTGLIYVVWEVTLRCDLHCGHCGSRAGKTRDDELSTDEALDVVRQLADMGTREVTLIGGEAYLREDWDVIARAIVERGMTCTMTTGGRFLDAGRATRAKAAGIASMSVSIDGIGETHDRQRGVKGAFEAALQALANLRAVGIPASVNTQINRLSFRELDQVLDLIIREQARSWQVQLTVPMGRAADNADWLLAPDDMLVVIPKIAELAARAKAHDVRIWPGNNIGYFGPHEHELRIGQTERGHSSGCQAGIHTLGLESDGAIKGCPSLPTDYYTGGHTRERSIRDVWESTKEMRFARDRSTETWGLCGDCYYADVCRGGCTWTAHVFFGRSGNNPYCHHRALELQAKGLRERLVRVTEAPGTPFDHALFEAIVEPITGPPPILATLATPHPAPARRLPTLG
jgi:radical SAM protein with 4Fe4S-binding SPASM domain